MYVLILTHFVNYVQNTPISVFPQQTVKNGKPTLCLTRDCSTETETDYSFFNAFYKFFNYNVQFSSSDDFEFCCCKKPGPMTCCGIRSF